MNYFIPQTREQYKNITREINYLAEKLQRAYLTMLPQFSQFLRTKSYNGTSIPKSYLFLDKTVESLLEETTKLNALRVIALSQEEYIYVCELIICAYEMSHYLNSRSIPKTIRRHVIYTKYIIKQFETLLQQIKNC